MHRELHRPIDLPVKFLPPEIKPRSNSSPETIFDHRPINHEFLSWLNDTGMSIMHGRLFVNTPHSRYKIHTDIPNPFPNNTCALNFVEGTDPGEMIWYQLQPDKTHSFHRHANGHILRTVEPHDMQEIYIDHHVPV